MISRHHVEQLNALYARANELQSAWLRQLLTLAAGALAVLVGLDPPATGIGKWFLAMTWLTLGAGILSGALATAQEAALAKARADALRAELLRSDLEASPPQPRVAKLPRLYVWSRATMLGSLLLSVVCLVAYAVLRALS